MLDLPHRHAPGVQADDHVVQAVQTTLALADQPRGERAGPVPGHVDGERADLGLDRLRRRAVTGIGPLDRGRLALLIAQMAGQLGPQTPLQGRLEQRRQQPVGPGDGDLTSIDPGEQIVQSTTGLQLGHQLVARHPAGVLLIGHRHQCHASLQNGLHRPSDRLDRRDGLDPGA